MDRARQIIVALDFDALTDAEAVVERLGDAGQSYKIGLELLTVAGPALATRLAAEGKDVFLDLKLFEIPTSVANAVRAAGRLGATMVTVHGMGGSRIMEAAVRAAVDFPQLRVIALTVVTSQTDADLAEIGVSATTEEQVTRLARLAQNAGCHGVVASPQDAAMLRAELGPGTLIVSPGVKLRAELASRAESASTAEPATRAESAARAEPASRAEPAARAESASRAEPASRAESASRAEPGDLAASDHARPAHPAAAIRAGATHIVVGRSLTRAPDPAAVLAHIRDELG